MNTSDIILNLLNENGNPNVNFRLNDNKNGTITINLEGVVSKDFPKPSDFEDHIKSTASRKRNKNQPPLIPRPMKVFMHIIAVIVLSTIVNIKMQADMHGLFNT